MYLSNIYKPLEQFVFTENQCLKCHCLLQNQCIDSRHSLLILPYPTRSFIVEVFHQSPCFVQLNLLLFLLLVIFFFLSWNLVAGYIHIGIALTWWFHLLTCHRRSGLPLLYYVPNNAGNSMLVNQRFWYILSSCESSAR